MQTAATSLASTAAFLRNFGWFLQQSCNAKTYSVAYSRTDMGQVLDRHMVQQ